jgi:hypothetical protein
MRHAVTLVFAVGAFRDATPIPRRTKKLMDRINSECVIRFTFTQSRRGGRRGGFSRLMLMPRCLHTWPPGMAAEAAPTPATVSLRRNRPDGRQCALCERRLRYVLNSSSVALTGAGIGRDHDRTAASTTAASGTTGFGGFGDRGDWCAERRFAERALVGSGMGISCDDRGGGTAAVVCRSGSGASSDRRDAAFA